MKVFLFRQLCLLPVDYGFRFTCNLIEREHCYYTLH